jgi:hypothetical protein
MLSSAAAKDSKGERLVWGGSQPIAKSGAIWYSRARVKPKIAALREISAATAEQYSPSAHFGTPQALTPKR